MKSPAWPVAFIWVVVALGVSGCPGETAIGRPDVGLTDAPRLDAPGLDAPGATDDGGSGADGDVATDGGALDSGTGGSDAASDAPRVSMPCMATGTCDPFDATSCALGEGCLLGMTGTACMTLAPTVARAGEVCTRTDGCEPGTACLSFAAEGFRCHRMCPEGSIGHCGAAATCSGTLGDACVRVCRPLPARCDIYAQDCVDAALSCSLAENLETGERYTGCRTPGTNAEGAACGGGMGACLEGLVCVSVDGTASCHRVCRQDGGAPSCTAPEVCTGRTGGWGVTYCRAPAAP